MSISLRVRWQCFFFFVFLCTGEKKNLLFTSVLFMNFYTSAKTLLICIQVLHSCSACYHHYGNFCFTPATTVLHFFIAVRVGQYTIRLLQLRGLNSPYQRRSRSRRSGWRARGDGVSRAGAAPDIHGIYFSKNK